MDFLKRKMSRLGTNLKYYKVSLRPKALELVVEASGNVFITFKRGRHKDSTRMYRVEAQGFGRQVV